MPELSKEETSDQLFCHCLGAVCCLADTQDKKKDDTVWGKRYNYRHPTAQKLGHYAVYYIILIYQYLNHNSSACVGVSDSQFDIGSHLTLSYITKLPAL